MQQHGSKYFARRPPSPTTLGDEVNRSKLLFSEHCSVAYQIKGNHEMQQRGSKYFACRSPNPHPLTLRMGSIGQTSTFSEHGHVVYQIKGNHECSNMVANIFPADPYPPADPPPSRP